jgi:hypothetical protein
MTTTFPGTGPNGATLPLKTQLANAKAALDEALSKFNTTDQANARAGNWADFEEGAKNGYQLSIDAIKARDWYNQLYKQVPVDNSYTIPEVTIVGELPTTSGPIVAGVGLAAILLYLLTRKSE